MEETQPLQVKFGLRLSQSRPLYEGFRYLSALLHPFCKSLAMWQSHSFGVVSWSEAVQR